MFCIQSNNSMIIHILLSLLIVEYTRVQLHMIEGIEHSDYINANYINVSL